MLFFYAAYQRKYAWFKKLAILTFKGDRIANFFFLFLIQNPPYKFDNIFYSVHWVPFISINYLLSHFLRSFSFAIVIIIQNKLNPRRFLMPDKTSLQLPEAFEH